MTLPGLENFSTIRFTLYNFHKNLPRNIKTKQLKDQTRSNNQFSMYTSSHLKVATSQVCHQQIFHYNCIFFFVFLFPAPSFIVFPSSSSIHASQHHRFFSEVVIDQTLFNISLVDYSFSDKLV